MCAYDSKIEVMMSLFLLLLLIALETGVLHCPMLFPSFHYDTNIAKIIKNKFERQGKVLFLFTTENTVCSL